MIYLVMSRTNDVNKLECMYTDKVEMMETWFPSGADEFNRDVESINKGEVIYYVEVDGNRSSLIESLIEETIINYKFENRW